MSLAQSGASHVSENPLNEPNLTFRGVRPVDRNLEMEA